MDGEQEEVIRLYCHRVYDVYDRCTWHGTNQRDWVCGLSTGQCADDSLAVFWLDLMRLDLVLCQYRKTSYGSMRRISDVKR
ncbi:hypothetical protein BJX70DRAFT_369869 [Aspergillus crustosus]